MRWIISQHIGTMGFFDDIHKMMHLVGRDCKIDPIKLLQDEAAHKRLEGFLSVDLRNKINDGDIPRYFYKYRSMQHALDIIRTGKLKFSTIDEFKDPFDGIGDWSIECSEEECNRTIDAFLSRLPADTPMVVKEIFTDELRKNPMTLQTYAAKSIEIMRTNAGIFCMSPIFDDIIMWSYYADSHRGVCLKLDILQDTALFSGINQVVYRNQMPAGNVLDASDASRLFWEAITTKYKYWYYEQEARVVHHRKNGFLPFNKKVLNEVLFGVYTTPDDVDEVRQALRENGFHNVHLKKARLNTTHYKLDFYDIGRV